MSKLKLEELLQLLDGILRPIDGVPNGPRVCEDLVVVSTREGLVAKEVDGLVFDTGDVLLGLDVLQAVSLVPTGWEDVERDLAADRVAVLPKISHY